jgi:hypothetical protein
VSDIFIEALEKIKRRKFLIIVLAIHKGIEMVFNEKKAIK